MFLLVCGISTKAVAEDIDFALAILSFESNEASQKLDSIDGLFTEVESLRAECQNMYQSLTQEQKDTVSGRIAAASSIYSSLLDRETAARVDLSEGAEAAAEMLSDYNNFLDWVDDYEQAISEFNAAEAKGQTLEIQLPLEVTEWTSIRDEMSAFGGM